MSADLPAHQGAPERAAFEAHVLAWTGRDMAYHIAGGTTGLEFAWSCWQAAQPKRAAVGAIMNVAAALAQRTPLAAFSALEDSSHIGHRQFRRAYDKADEDTRLLAVKLADAVRALKAATTGTPKP